MSVKPFIHWAIYKEYTVRFTRRHPHVVEGLLTTPEGSVPFRYETGPQLIHLFEGSAGETTVPTRSVAINQYGWELSQDAGEPDEK